MKCKCAKEYLSAYVDDMLDAPARNDLEKHLNTCRGCTEELLMLKKYLAEVASLQKVKAPDDFIEKVKQRITRRLEFEKMTRALFIPGKIKIPLEAAGVILTVVLVVISYRIIEPGIKHFPSQKDMSLSRDNLQTSGIIGNEAQPETIHQDKRLDSSYEMQESYELAPRQTEIAAESIPESDMEDVITFGQQDIQEPISAEPVEYMQESLPNREQEMLAMRTVNKANALAKSVEPLAMSGAGKQYDLYVRITDKYFTLDDAVFKTKRLVKSESGIIIFVETAQDQQSRIVVLNFPAKNYATLINKMKSVGKIHYQPANFGEDSNELINLRVHLILSQ